MIKYFHQKSQIGWSKNDQKNKTQNWLKIIKNDDFMKIIKNDDFRKSSKMIYFMKIIKNDDFMKIIKNDHFQNFRKSSNISSIFIISHMLAWKIIKNDQIFSKIKNQISKISKNTSSWKNLSIGRPPKKRDRVSQNKGVCTISLYYKYALLNPHFCLLTPKNVVDDVFPF